MPQDNGIPFHDLINFVKALLALVGHATAIEPWTLGDLGGSGLASKIYDDLDTDVSNARRPEHSLRSNLPKPEQVSSLNLINSLNLIKITFIKMTIVRFCPTGKQPT